MTGVEILSSETIYETEFYPWLIALFASIGLLIGLGIAIWFLTQNLFHIDDIAMVVVITVIGAFIGFLVVVATEHETDIIDHIEYKVTVSEDVNFAEFMNKYEIIDQEGKIYTVKERE